MDDRKMPSLFQKNLADYLTLSRVFIGLVILLLAFIGKDVFLIVLSLVFIGALTDILDGRVARRYLNEGEESRLGRYDIVADIIFILCIIAYLSFSGIVLSALAGIGWIALVLLASWLTAGDRRVLTILEVISAIAVYIVVLIYDSHLFFLLVLPVTMLMAVINRHRLQQLMLRQWPLLFSKDP